MPYEPEEQCFDVVVVGAGGAGLRTACAAAEGGLRVAVLSKVPPTRSHTVAAQGGINAALGARTPDDWRWHMYDTVRGADWLGDQDAIAFMCAQAPAAILELERMGMPFSRDENGRIYQRAYGGQRADYGKGPLAYRACAVADRTGHALLHTLYAQALHCGVTFFVECLALDLLMSEDGACRGALAWELETGRMLAFRAHATVLATGGYGQIYASTTSSSICTGDGNAMALRAGLPLQDMEFIQFHPTGLYGTGVLITEAARGEGGVLLNANGERFMQRYAPSAGDLASRDVVARAMVQEMREGRGCGPKKDHLHLSVAHLSPQVLQEKLPAICDIARRFARVDPARDPIPVVPTVHYTMGGIASNAASEVMDKNLRPVEGLRVVGETACNSVHGANRLGCNALLDLVVFGKATGTALAAQLRAHAALPPLPRPPLEKALGRFDALRHAKGNTSCRDLRRRMQSIMQEHAGIFRSEAQLQAGLAAMQGMYNALSGEIGLQDRSLIWNAGLAEVVELHNLLPQAGVALAGALARRESRGAHFREDYPARDDRDWLVHTLAWLDENGRMQLAKRPVALHGNTASDPAFVPETRSY